MNNLGLNPLITSWDLLPERDIENRLSAPIYFATEPLKLCVTFSKRAHTLDQIATFFKERLQLKIKHFHEPEYTVNEISKQSLLTKEVVSYSSNDEVKMKLSFAFKAEINYRRSGSIYSLWMADQCLVEEIVVLAKTSFTQLCQAYKLSVDQWKNVYNWTRFIPWLEKFAIEKRLILKPRLFVPNPILKTKVEFIFHGGLSSTSKTISVHPQDEISLRFNCSFSHSPLPADLLISPTRVKFLSIEPIYGTKMEPSIGFVPITRNDSEVTFDLTFTLEGTAKGVYSVWLDEYLILEEMKVVPRRSIKKMVTQPKTLNLLSKKNHKHDKRKAVKKVQEGFSFQDSGDRQLDLRTTGVPLPITQDKSQEAQQKNKADQLIKAPYLIQNDDKSTSQVLVEKEFLLPLVKEPSDGWRNPSEAPVRALLNKNNWSSLLVLKRYILEEKYKQGQKFFDQQSG